MKTIGFYSYKGGTGKSLLAANLAVTLSRLGKTTVLVDCDVEGPSLHNKFLPVGRGALGRGGLVGLVSAHLRNCDWHRDTAATVTPSLVKTIEPYLYQLPAPWQPAFEKSDREAGRLYLLPAGDIHRNEYWSIVWSPLWRDLFTSYGRIDDGPEARACYGKMLTFLASVKNALSRLSPAPEYMIVDFRSGASDLATTFMNAWVDTLVYTLCFNEDNINHLGSTYHQLISTLKDKDNDGDQSSLAALELALCRVPIGFDYYRGDRELWATLENMRLTSQDLHIIHSDRDLEMLERIRVGYQATPENRRLTRDYLALFETLIDAPDASAEEGWLIDAIGLPKDVAERDRVFIWEAEVGALINPSDGTRNVAFKVETFHLLLQGLMDELAASAESAEEKQQLLERLLFSAGLKCGETFGQSLAKKWRSSTMGVEERLRTWCKFDSDVGFGRFELDADTIHAKGRRLLECNIRVHESFITPAKDTSFKGHDHRYCEFMTGYITGVISKLIGGDVVVTHSSEAEVMRPDQKSESCAFNIKGQREGTV